LHIDYEALPLPVREAIAERTGKVRNAQSAEAGTNSAVAALLDTESGPVFLKGLPKDHRGVRAQQREADVAPFVTEVSPRLLWHAELEGWDLLGFQAVEGGRHPDYAPGSDDVPKVLRVLDTLHATPCPPVPMFSAERRWADLLEDPADARQFAGTSFLHTDWNRFNILVTGQRAWLLDWAWATWGAAFIDPALFIPRLIAAGHTPAQAEGWAEKSAAWQRADQKAVTLFAVVVARHLQLFADGDPAAEWRQPMVEASQRWAAYRGAM
jgi:hypothetical protein